ncbi:MAG: hypothetical protein LBE36_14180 [Flavobacteriaceae bacterium]|jgi:hypothetical protein|nr:hypothetical protein [Flavobacteriaceae bacterium]
MDAAIDIKKRIIEFIDHADERILNVFNGIINAEMELSKQHKAIFCGLQR